MFNFSDQERRLFQKLNTPQKIQRFLNAIPINFEEKGDTCYSPRQVLRKKKAHCMEGALLAATILRFHGHPPLVVDMTATKNDFDHVITVFKQHNHWGAISKTNHAVLRFRDPIYKTIRELILSYFHEYFDNKGRKNLRSYTEPIDLSRFDKYNWMTSEEEVWYIPDYLAEVKHFPLVSRKQIALLKKPDRIEIKAGELLEWNKNRLKKR